MKKNAVSAAVVVALALSVGISPLGARRASAAGIAAQATSDDVKIRALLQRIEQIAQQSNIPAYVDLLAGSADSAAATNFATLEFRPGAGRVVIQERERQDLRGTLPGNGYSLTLDAFIEYGDRARAVTWQLDVKRVDDDWRIAGQERVSAVENLYRLSLNSSKQFDATNFTITSEDLELTMTEGTVFVVETNQGVTGLVLLGRGDMKFHPSPETEKGQVRIFAGSDTLDTRFENAFVRVGTFDEHADPRTLKPRPVDPRDLKRAEQIFREESGKSFVVDLADLTRDTWSLLPGSDDFLAEIRTRRYETLTYVRSASEAEDISFFERRRHRNIAVYTSREKLAARGRFYNEDDNAPFDVLDYDIEVSTLPDRRWIEGRAVMRLRVRAPSLSQLTIRLADSLVVRSVSSDQFGRLFNLRVTNQNMILVNLPATVVQGTDMKVTVEYSGRLETQTPDRETLALGGQRDIGQPADAEDPSFPRPESSYLYSNLSYWYPQSTVSDYATATIQIIVPAAYGCVASGEQASDSPRLLPAGDGLPARKVYMFSAERPLRYLAFLVSRLQRADRWTVVFDSESASNSSQSRSAADVSGSDYDKLDLIVESNPRQTGRGRDLAERAVDIVQFYESIVGDSPYSTFSVALIENALPGGHSPAYFAIVNQPMSSGVTWRNDPAAFASYPEFFLAHEIAHQWWGQAVGWRNYHEQWLSEGFAQYFAALYAQKMRGDEVFENVMRQMRKWAIDESDQGPVYLGYRVGHIKNSGRAFRSVVYNKGAAVLHMLRRLVGDEAFFRGMRRFYVESRFTKVGTDDFRQAMEAESGRSLDRFFERWIYNGSLPRVTLSYRVEARSKGSMGSIGSNGSRGSAGSAGSSAPTAAVSSAAQEVVLHFEQAGEIFDFPVTVTLQYVDRKSVDVVVPVTDRVVELRVPLEGALRTIDVSRDDGTVADVTVIR